MLKESLLCQGFSQAARHIVSEDAKDSCKKSHDQIPFGWCLQIFFVVVVGVISECFILKNSLFALHTLQKKKVNSVHSLRLSFVIRNLL